MTDDDSVVAEARKLRIDRVFPNGVAWIAFIRHLWVANLVTRAKQIAKAVYKFSIPLVMRALASTLNKKNLFSHYIKSVID
jgi:hypothetical protein